MCARRPMLDGSLARMTKYRGRCRFRTHKSKRNMAERIQGRVKWFNEEKGFGFIEREDGGEDVFLHFSALNQAGFKTVKEDARVEFIVTMGPKGPKAEDVITL